MDLLNRNLRIRNALALLVLLVPVSSGLAQPPTAAEYRVKAAYLYNFTKYIEWPPGAFASASAPIVIGILGDDPFGKLLEETIRGRTSQGRPVTIRRSRRVDDLRDCQIVFISGSEKTELDATLAILAQRNVVTVCDTGPPFDRGVTIRLMVADATVQFEVRLDAAEGLGVRFNSRMLEAAGKVWRSGGRVEGR